MLLDTIIAPIPTQLQDVGQIDCARTNRSESHDHIHVHAFSNKLVRPLYRCSVGSSTAATETAHLASWAKRGHGVAFQWPSNRSSFDEPILRDMLYECSWVMFLQIVFQCPHDPARARKARRRWELDEGFRCIDGNRVSLRVTKPTHGSRRRMSVRWRAARARWNEH